MEKPEETGDETLRISDRAAENKEICFPLLSISRLRMGTDGRGITTLVAGAGCPLDCRFCINKEMLERGRVRSVTSEWLYEEVSCDELYFLSTGGGVTFGGGEALLHSAFYGAFRKLCGSSWRLSVETSLAVPRSNVEMAADQIDEFIVDCKDMDPDIYNEYTGGEAALMLGNLRFLLEKAGAERIIVRVPLIPGYNTEKDRERSVKLLKEMGIKRLELFDYVIKQ